MGLHRSQISIGNYAHPLYSFDRFLACAERLQIQNLELWGAGPHFYFYDYTDERAKEFYRKIADKGMKVICITPEQCMYPINIACDDPVMRRRSIDYFKRGVEFCRIMDCPMMLVTPGKGYFDRPRQEAWERSVQALQEIGGYAHSAGVRIAMEHLTQMSSNVAVTAKEAAALVQAVGLPNVGGMVDTDMAGRIGEGVADFLSALDNKLVHVHLVRRVHHAGSDARELPAGAGKGPGTDGALDGRGLCPHGRRRKTALRRFAPANHPVLPSLPRRRRRTAADDVKQFA